MKRIIAITLSIALIAAVFWVVNPFTPAYAGEYRNGFLITPTHYDATGVYTNTGFILKTEENYTLEQIKEMISLAGDLALEITQNKPDEFLIKPVNTLSTNSLYKFIIAPPDKEAVLWTFQTRRDFAILGTLPANESSYVPANSGIEIYFSHTGFGDLEKYFEISPKVQGRFERSGFTAVFIPKALEAGTIYTVTIKAGLPLNGTDQKLQKDYVFAFETEPEQTGRTEPKGSLYFRNSLMEFATNEAPLIPIDIYSRNNEIASGIVKTTVYRYNSMQDFIDAIKTKYDQPVWAYSVQEKNLLPTDGLAKAASFEQTFDLTKWQERYLSLPEALPGGFYLVESTFEDMTVQVLVQSTDLAAYFTESETKTIFWLNSLADRKPVANAQISISGESDVHSTNESGVAIFDTVEKKTDETGRYELQYFTIKGIGQELVIINSGYRTYWDKNYATQDYWRYFHTDRNLYKPDDLVQFWGFLQNRYDGTSPSQLTVEIAEGGYWGIPEARLLGYFLPSIQKPLVTIKVPADNGFFEGSFRLPKLSPGGYQITVKNGDEIVNSYYITVENYVKPAYKMTVEKDKKAIFLGETVNFTVIPAFFDGTPLPFLDISYNMGGYPFSSVSKTEKTGTDGKLIVPFTANTTEAEAQGEQHMYINASASLPESGMIYGNEHVRVFINDLYASFESNTNKDGITTLKATLNQVDLSRINSNEEITVYPDYLGKPVPNKTLSGSIIYHYYVKIEDGEEYDYINKVVNKKYRYEERQKTVQNFSFTTNDKGTATGFFTLDDPKEGYYTAELNWQDGNGRRMTGRVYLSNRYVKTLEAQYDWYRLEADREKYRVGDDVTVTLKNNDEIVSADAVLFIEAQRGITGYAVQNSSEYKTRFDTKDIPNFHISAVFFNGKSYTNAGTEIIRYDADEMKLDIQMEADKEAYRPGDTVTVKITARDESGKPVAARINLGIIDEAMLEISYYGVDVLNTLYAWLDSGLGYSYSTHSHGSSVPRVTMVKIADGAAPTPAPLMKQESLMNMDVSFSGVRELESIGGGMAGMADVQVRSDFRDTAVFLSASLDEDGTGTVSFKLPDNVTSWMVTVAGISPDLHGGTGKADLKVTLPFFINDSLNTTYLSGDFPYIGVTGYGNDLKEGETITWQITSPQLPDYIQTAKGKAFERTNIPLWKLEAGEYDIEIKAISESGLSDGIKRTIRVFDTYHEIEEAVTEELKANMKLTGGKDGLTTLLFTDEGRGKMVPVLYGLLYSGGSRLDQKYTALRAKLLLDEIAPDSKNMHGAGEVNLTDYRKPDGGYGILPYSESDVELSALLSSLLKDEGGAQGLKQYFYSLIFAEPGRVNAPALYGLAELGEPVLVDLNNAIEVKNLSIRDYMYLALAFDALGETPPALKIYNEHVLPVLENKKPYIRFKNSDDADEILKNTALAAVLASRLDMPEKEGLFEYVKGNYSRKVLTSTEKLLVVLEEYKKLPETDVEFTYEYDGKTYTENLKEGGSVWVKVPSARISDVKIKKVTGKASVVSVFKAPLTKEVKPDDNLKISRKYYDYKTGMEATEFKQNDIVKVVLEWDIAPTAMDSFYEITDFAPSGLKPIESPYQAGIRPEKGIIWWFRNTDGQKVTFNVFRDSEKKEPMVYYARVVSPGTFTADSTIIQGTLVKDSIKLGENASIKISE